MVLPFTAGQIVTAADLNTATQQSAWTTYTPVWTAVSVNPTNSGGSIIGRYAKVGRMVTVKAGIYCSGSTTFGTGAYSLSLPLPAVVTGTPSSLFAFAGSWALADNGTTFYNANAMIVGDVPGEVNGIVDGSVAFVGHNNPTAWTASTSTQFVVTITYETAS